MKRASETVECKNLVNNIIFLRKKYGISKKVMAEILGVCVETLNKIERGELPPRLNLEIVFNIQKYFGICPKDIMENGIVFS